MGQVAFERDGDVAVITMDDGKANALSPSLIEEIGAAFDRAEQEAEAVVLTGREGRFCAGFDLKILMGGGQPAKDLFMAGGELFLRIYLHPQPVVTAATGHAIAGGALLLGVGDVRVGAIGDFKIGLNEISIGVPLPVFALEIAQAVIATPHLFDATLRAKVYRPTEAATVGWLNGAVDASVLAETALREANALAALPGKPFAISKHSQRRALADRVRAVTEDDLEEILRRMSVG